MDPQQTPNYDFIMSPEKKTAGPLASQSMLQRVMIFGGGLVILLIIGTVIAGFLRGGDATKPALISLIREQKVISHVAEVALEEQSLSEANGNSLATIQLVMTTHQQELLTYASQIDIGLKPKDILISTVKIDESLNAAVSGGTYNTALRTTLKTELEIYQATLKRAYSEIKGPRGREILQRQYDGTNLLLKQLTTTQ